MTSGPHKTDVSYPTVQSPGLKKERQWLKVMDGRWVTAFSDVHKQPSIFRSELRSTRSYLQITWNKTNCAVAYFVATFFFF